MDGRTLAWIIILLFILLVAGFTVLEALWLSKKDWAGFRSALVFSIVTNIIGFGFGAVVDGIVLLAILFVAMASSGGSLSAEAGDRMILAFELAIFTNPVLLMLCKRIFLSSMKMRSGSSAWVYALISALMIFLVSGGIPCLIAYFLFFRG